MNVERLFHVDIPWIITLLLITTKAPKGLLKNNSNLDLRTGFVSICARFSPIEIFLTSPVV